MSADELIYNVGGVIHTELKNLNIINDVKIQPEKNLIAITMLMRCVDSIFRDNNIQYFALSGTLLGAYRHNGVIPWDDDIDIGVHRSFIDKIKKLNKNFDDYGYKIYETNPGFKILSTDETGFETWCDIFIMDFDIVDGLFKYCYPIIDNKSTFFTDKIFSKEKFKGDQIFPLKEKIFEGFKIFIPNKSIEVLEICYDKKALTDVYFNESSYMAHKFNHVFIKSGADKVGEIFPFWFQHRLLKTFNLGN